MRKHSKVLSDLYPWGSGTIGRWIHLNIDPNEKGIGNNHLGSKSINGIDVRPWLLLFSPSFVGKVFGKKTHKSGSFRIFAWQAEHSLKMLWHPKVLYLGFFVLKCSLLILPTRKNYCKSKTIAAFFGPGNRCKENIKSGIVNHSSCQGHLKFSQKVESTDIETMLGGWSYLGAPCPPQLSVLMYWTGRSFWFVIFLRIHGLSVGKCAKLTWDIQGTMYRRKALQLK